MQSVHCKQLNSGKNQFIEKVFTLFGRECLYRL